VEWDGECSDRLNWIFEWENEECKEKNLLENIYWEGINIKMNLGEANISCG
jgi:hypothetical protein